jgi:hypothetical protein
MEMLMYCREKTERQIRSLPLSLELRHNNILNVLCWDSRWWKNIMNQLTIYIQVESKKNFE